MTQTVKQQLSVRRELFRSLLVGLFAGGAAGASYATLVEPSWVEVARVPLLLPRLPKEFHGYRVAQISDFHIEWLGEDQLASVVSLVNSLEPDLIVLTGDYVTEVHESAAEKLVPPLSKLKARDGVVGVLGNHDYWGSMGPGLIREALRAGNVIDINNSVYTVSREGKPLYIGGVDSARAGKDRLDRVLAALPEEGAAILAVHEPDFADTSARSGRFDLQISGHSHGGQVVIPYVGPPHLPPMAKKYHTGLYRVGSMLQYTNRGLGTVGIPVRFWCRPEVTLFSLQSPEAETEGADLVL